MKLLASPNFRRSATSDSSSSWPIDFSEASSHIRYLPALETAARSPLGLSFW